MDSMNAVTLRVNGMDYGGWKKVSISAGIERQARDFQLDVTWSWPEHMEQLPVRQGDFCEVLIGEDRVLSGWIFATPVRYSAREVTRSIKGRSLTADLVDCSAVNQPGQWRQQSVQQIVTALAEPYGIRVLSQVADTSSMADHTIEPGETVFESIDRLLTLSRLLSTDDPRGRLVIIKPGSAGRAVDRLQLGDNLLEGSAELDFSEVFSEYRVTGQRSGTNTQYGAQASEVKSSVTDPRAARKRVLLIHESGQMTPELASARANWERGSRMGKALTLNYKVQGWRQSNGALWLPNMIVRIVDPLGVNDVATVGAGGLQGGTEQEGIEALRARVIRSYRVVPHGGSTSDYETWALEVPGVTRAWVVRHWAGPGTVAVFIVRDNDLDPIPTPQACAVVREYIEQERPVTAEVYVLPPVEKPVQYQIKIVPDSSAVRRAVEAELIDLHNRESALGAELLISHIREAISGATGERDHDVISPPGNVSAAANQLLTYGGVLWR